jgi:WD40 repeat protein
MPRFHIRFSLRTLILLPLLIGAVLALSKKWQPWVASRFDYTTVSAATFTPDGRRVVIEAEESKTGQTLVLLSADGDHLQGKSVQAQDYSELLNFDSRVQLRLQQDAQKNWNLRNDLITTNYAPLLHSSLPKLRLGMSVSPDMNLIASYGMDKNVVLLHPQGEVVAELQHPAWVRSAEFSADGKYILTACKDHLIRIWDIETQKVLQTLSGHDAEVTRASYLDAQRIISSSYDCTVKIWNGSVCERTITFENGVRELVLSPDKKFFVAFIDGHDEINAEVWSLAHPARLPDFRVFKISGARFSYDSSRLITWDDSDTLVWEIASGRLVHEIADRKCVAVSPAENAFLTLPAQGGELLLHRQQRTENGWGLACLPEFWLTLTLIVGFALSCVKDIGELTLQPATAPKKGRSLHITPSPVSR